MSSKVANLLLALALLACVPSARPFASTSQASGPSRAGLSANETPLEAKVGMRWQAMMTAKNLDFTGKLKSITDDVCVELSNLITDSSVLKTLTLSWNEIGEDCAKEFASALVAAPRSSLTELYLNENQIGSVGATAVTKALALADHTSLQVLDLTENKISDDGATNIAEVLEQARVLKTLKLGVNDIGDEGAHALANALKVNKGLSRLHLGDNHIGNKGATALVDAAVALEMLELEGNTLSEEEKEALLERSPDSLNLVTRR